MSTDAYVGEIQIYPYTFTPAGFRTCDGSLIPINQNQALFALLGVTYGGDGVSTFGLPDLRGRSIVGIGSGPGLSSIVLGQKAGNESVTILETQMPTHTHAATATSTLYAEGATANDNIPEGNLLATASNGTNIYTGSVPSPNQSLASDAIVTTVRVNPAGGSQPLQIRNPYLGLNICISLQGIFPSRP